MSAPSSIVAAIDFSPGSATVLGEAVRLGRSVNASVHAVHFIDTVVVMGMEDGLSPLGISIREALVQDARKSWADFTAQHPEFAGVPYTVDIDNALTAVTRRTRELGAELLVLGLQGEGESSSGAGTFATACVRYAPSPVLLVRADHRGSFRSVVACVDFSDASKLAVEHAAALARADSAALHVLHVYTSPRHSRWPSLHRVGQADGGHLLASLDERLRAFTEPALGPTAGLSIEYHLVDATSHGRAIGDFARKHHADLAVLGTRGRTNLRDILLGSTAERVLREAPCSVLAVRPRSA